MVTVEEMEVEGGRVEVYCVIRMFSIDVYGRIMCRSSEEP